MFEVFRTKDGTTVAYKETIAEVERMISFAHGSTLDYCEAKPGYYIKAVSGRVYSIRGPYTSKEEADNIATISNMGSDINSYHVIEHSPVKRNYYA